MVVAAGQHPDMRRLDQAGRLDIPACVREDGVAGRRQGSEVGHHRPGDEADGGVLGKSQ
jgi:hypothetical protein